MTHNQWRAQGRDFNLYPPREWLCIKICVKILLSIFYFFFIICSLAACKYWFILCLIVICLLNGYCWSIHFGYDTFWHKTIFLPLLLCMNSIKYPWPTKGQCDWHTTIAQYYKAKNDKKQNKITLLLLLLIYIPWTYICTYFIQLQTIVFVKCNSGQHVHHVIVN